MKNILFLAILISMFFTSCESHIIGNYESPIVTSVMFFPEKVERGDIITITYDLARKTFPKMPWIDDMSVDSNGRLKYVGDGDYDYINELGSGFDNLVEFGILNRGQFKTEDGILAEKYISFNWGEIKCYVPEAASGYIKLNIGMDFDYELSCSKEKLIVVDESGDEIW